MPYQDLPSSESGAQSEHPFAEEVRHPPPQPQRTSPHNLFIAVAILLLVCSALLRTYRSSTSESSRTVSELTSEIDTAMQATKTAYAFQTPAASSGDGSSKTLSQLKSRARRAAENEAILAWRKLAAPNHPVSSRRLGLTLFMFRRKGGLDVLLSVGAYSGQRPGVRGQRQTTGGDGERGRQATIANDEEQAAWRSLYGVNPVAVRDVPQLRACIGKMNLGWFYNIAMEQLYSRAGMVRESRAAHLAAYRSAARLASADDIELTLFFVGILMWIAVVIRSLARRLLVHLPSSAIPNTERATPNTQYPPHLTSPTEWRGIDAHSVPTPNADRPTPIFSYRARTTAFAVFLATYLFIGYPLRALLPDMHKWSDTAVMRLSSILQMVLYLPVVLLALYTLRRIAGAESMQSNRPKFRQTLAALGLRSSHPFADIAAGIQGYVMIVPLFLLAALVSARLFQTVHTPINPVQLQALSAIGPLDQLLMLIETAIAAPIVEELMFRGLLFPALKSRWGYVGGVVLTSAVFGLLHPNLPAGFLPLWALGAAFAVVFQRRQSLLPCIVMHSLHNGFVTIMMFVVFAK